MTNRFGFFSINNLLHEKNTLKKREWRVRKSFAVSTRCGDSCLKSYTTQYIIMLTTLHVPNIKTSWAKCHNQILGDKTFPPLYSIIRWRRRYHLTITFLRIYKYWGEYYKLKIVLKLFPKYLEKDCVDLALFLHVVGNFNRCNNSRFIGRRKLVSSGRSVVVNREVLFPVWRLRCFERFKSERTHEENLEDTERRITVFRYNSLSSIIKLSWLYL